MRKTGTRGRRKEKLFRIRGRNPCVQKNSKDSARPGFNTMSTEEKSDTEGRRLRIKRTWFDQGVAALARVRQEFDGYYACPLCLVGFDAGELSRLTREHVPPRSLGGKHLVLTCDDCNHRRGGGKVDG